MIHSIFQNYFPSSLRCTFTSTSQVSLKSHCYHSLTSTFTGHFALGNSHLTGHAISNSEGRFPADSAPTDNRRLAPTQVTIASLLFPPWALAAASILAPPQPSVSLNHSPGRLQQSRHAVATHRPRLHSTNRLPRDRPRHRSLFLSQCRT